MERILHVVKAMNPGGVENMLMNLYRVLDKESFQFDFLINEKESNYFAPEIKNLGGRIYQVPLFTGTNLLTYSKHVKALLKEHPEWKIVHGHLGSAAPVYLNIANQLGRTTIAHSHSSFGTPSLSTFFENALFEGLTFPTRYIADYFLACSKKAGRDRFGKKIVSGDRFNILNNSIDLKRFSNSDLEKERARKQLGLEGKFVIGSVGRLAKEKNQSFLISLFLNLKKQVPNVALVLVGDGPEKKILQDEAERLGLKKDVYFMGNVAYPETISKAFDVFVMPSYYEGLPMALVEAQALGIPCVISDGIPPEAILTENVSQFSLDSPNEQWMNALLRYKGGIGNFQADNEAVRKHGYDVFETGKWLEKYYFKLIKLAEKR